MPTGAILPFAMGAVPPGYLACDGADYAAADYVALFLAIGNTWDTFRGQADPGAGRFRVPLLDGLALIGAGSAGSSPATTARALGDVLGEEEHTLTKPEMPTHNHPVTDPGHSHTDLTGGGLWAVALGNDTPNPTPGVGNMRNDATTSSNLTGITTDNEGDGDPHNNVQPSVAIVWGIKT